MLKKIFALSIAFALSNFVHAQGHALFLDSPVKWVNAGNINVTGSNVTLEALIHITGASGGNVISKHTGPTNVNYLLRAQSFEITTSNGYANLINPFILEPGNTYHIAATYNGSMMRFYVNGCLTAEQPWSGTLVTNTFATAIGQQSNCQCEQFTGYIDEARIWNVARTENQIRSNMYNIANPNFQFNLLAYFKFQNNFNNIAFLAPGATTIGGPNLVGLPYPYPSALHISNTGSNVICHDSSTGAIDLQASGGIQPYQFSFDGTNYADELILSDLSAGNYTVYVKSNENCIVTATQTIQNKTPINLNLNIDNVSCHGDTDGAASVNPTGGNGANFSVTWSNNASGSSIGNLPPGTHTVTVRDSCRVAGNELVVNGHFEEGAVGFTTAYNSCGNCYIGIGEELFENQFVVGVNANHHHVAFNGTGQGGGGNFMIINGSSQPNTNVWCQTIAVQPNTYYEFSTWVTSIFAQSPAELQFQANGVLMGPVFTAPNTVNTWSQFFTTWFSGTNNSVNICILNQNTSISGNDFGLDNISFKACLSCEVESDFTIQEPDPISATATVQNAVCGTNTGVIEVTASGGTSPFSYSIDAQTFNPNSTIANLAPGAYTITVKDAADCEFIIEVVVEDDDDLNIDAGLDQEICAGESVTLNAIGPAGFIWSDNVINNEPFFPSQSQYFVVEINLGPTCFASDSVFITVHPLPNVIAGEDLELCEGQTLSLNATGALTYTWSNNIANNESFTLDAGNYTFSVVGTDANGCSNSDDVNIVVLITPTVSVSATPENGIVPLTVDFTNNNLETFDYNWYFGQGATQVINTSNTSYTFANTGQFWVTVSAENQGCIGLDSLLITVISASLEFQIPNVFSPNGDENNPFFQLIHLSGVEQVTSFEVLILNRWGQIIRIFETPEFSWDGTDNAGNALTEGVYFYKMNYRLQDDTEGQKHGFVHLVR